MSAPHTKPTHTIRPRATKSVGGARLVIPAVLLIAATALIAVAAAWPIYQTGRLWWIAALGSLLASATVWLGLRLRWGIFTPLAVALVFALSSVPLANPQALSGGPAAWANGLLDALAATALGWKQLLTLTLPVGSYQTMLVPFLVTVMLGAAIIAAFTLRGGRFIPLAALAPLIAVGFGTVFGSSAVSAPLHLGPITIGAPRELALWLIAAALAASWVAWSSTIERRAALKRGRLSGVDHAETHAAARSTAARSGLARGLVAGLTLVVALGAGVALAPVLDSGTRTVPRDQVDPNLIVQQQTSPLAEYRLWKRDAQLEAPLFTVSSDGDLPGRLRLAVLDVYDGVDFSAGTSGEAGRFTRFPSGERVSVSAYVTIAIDEAYRGIWVPVATPLADPPRFSGPRESALADSFYVNRDTGSAVAVPTVNGLRGGDGFTARMSLEPQTLLSAGPAVAEPLIDLESMPQLALWLETQQVSASAEGLQTALTRLAKRGYLSHSLTDGEGENAWIQALSSETNLKFFSSTGGHSVARIEQLFEKLNDQQAAAGPDADDEFLVAAIGDDEQFAAAGALLARALGYNSRVVVGVRLAEDSGADAGASASGVPGVSGVPACAETCVGQNLAAWIEVRGSDGVWAPFDVSPQIQTPPQLLQKGEQLPEFPTQPEERDAVESDPAVGANEQDSADPQEPESEGGVLLVRIAKIVGVSLAALVLIAVPLLFLPFVKRRRRAKRAAVPEAELLVLGSWQTLIDDYADHGDAEVIAEAGSSRRDIADALEIPGGEWIAWVVDRAVYAPEAITPPEVEWLQQSVAAVLTERRSERRFWAKLKGAYSLRSLGVRSRRAVLRKRGAQ